MPRCRCFLDFSFFYSLCHCFLATPPSVSLFYLFYFFTPIFGTSPALEVGQFSFEAGASLFSNENETVIYLSIHPSIYLSICIIRVSFYLPTYLYVYPSIYPSIYLSSFFLLFCAFICPASPSPSPCLRLFSSLSFSLQLEPDQ